MQVTCLGVLIDTMKGTIAIPPEKLDQINQAVSQWLVKIWHQVGVYSSIEC